MNRVEYLTDPALGTKATNFMQILGECCPVPFSAVEAPSSPEVTLMVCGPGAPSRLAIANAHRAKGGRVVIWDGGYFRAPGYWRTSADHEHPQHLLDRAPADKSRFAALKIQLRNDFNPKGHIILVGLGPKTRDIMDVKDWEARKLCELRQRFPKARIIFRPKPKRPHPVLNIPVSKDVPIEQVLRGAALVVCKHSNCGVDAVVAGIPFETEDGAAKWLDGKAYTPANRLEFLQRLAWFMWRSDEAPQAWTMVARMLETP
jgi:hypothetical protein